MIVVLMSEYFFCVGNFCIFSWSLRWPSILIQDPLRSLNPLHLLLQKLHIVALLYILTLLRRAVRQLQYPSLRLAQ